MSKIFRRVVQYFKYDLKEILNPTGLPDPPGTPQRKSITVKRILIAIREGTLDYIDSWRKVPRREIHLKEIAEEQAQEGGWTDEQGRPVLEDIAETVNKGNFDLRLILQKLYYSRARVLRRTVEEFAIGFKDELQKAKRRP